MIKVTDLSKNFGELKALDKVSFSVPKGSIFGLVGANRSEERRVGKECRSRWSPYH